MRKWITTNRILVLAIVEAIILLLYTVRSIVTYSDREIVFNEKDMQVMDVDRNVSSGTYLDTSYESAKAVVTPAFSLDKGIYYITVSYRGNGIIKAGLIYDKPRNGDELFEGNEFNLNSHLDNILYRVKIKDNSPVRFKIRLTGDAVDGDYVQLRDVRIVSSDLTYVYSIFCLFILLVLVDLLLFAYFRYYKALSPTQQMICIVLAFTAFFAGLPFYQSGLATSKDLTFHLQRIEGVYKGLVSGQFPVRIQPGWLDGNGYASSIFYCDLLLYFPAMLRMVGFTVQEAYKIYTEIINVAAVWIAFYACRRMTKDDISAMWGGALYGGSANRLFWLHAEAVGTFSGMIFYPLIIAGFYLLFTEDVKDKAYKRLWILLTVGFSGLLMTHIISCLMVGVFSAFACLFMIKRLFRKETLLEVGKAVLMSVLFNLWFLVPLLHYLFTQKLFINRNLSGDPTNNDYYALLADFTQTQGKKYFYNLFISQNIFGYALLIVLLLYVVTIPIQKKSPLAKSTRMMFLYTIFVFWVCTAYFPIEKFAEKSRWVLKFCQTIQYQVRLFSVAVALAACFGALFVAANVLEKKLMYLIVGLLCCVNLHQNLQYFETVTSEVVILDDIDLPANSGPGGGIYSYGIGNAEYLPIAVDVSKLTTEIQAEDVLQIIANERRYLTYDTDVINTSDQEQSITYPILYYTGYRTFDTQNGYELETSAGDNGRVEVKIPAGYSGTVHMAFCEPWYWRMAEIISLLTFGFILYYVSKYRGMKISMKNIIQKGERLQNGD